MKMGSRGVENQRESGPGGSEIDGNLTLEGSWGTFRNLRRDFLHIPVAIGAKMGAIWAKLGPSCQQVAPEMGHDNSRMAILGSTWEV